MSEIIIKAFDDFRKLEEKIIEVERVLHPITRSELNSLRQHLSLNFQKIKEEHDALLQEVKDYQKKERICSSCAEHPQKMIIAERRAEKAEAEVERLRLYIKNLPSIIRGDDEE